MLREYKLLFSHLDQKALLLKALSLLLNIYYMTKQPLPGPLLASGLIGITTSFAVLEFSGNVFGLDGGAFYLHYTGLRPAWQAMVRRVATALSVQCALAGILSALFVFKYEAADARLHVLLLVILALQHFCTGCLFSAFFPTAIPRDLRHKMFRSNPGTGFAWSAALVFITLFGFYALAKVLPGSVATRCYYGYIFFLLAAIPLSVIVSARELGRKKYRKWQSLNVPE